MAETDPTEQAIQAVLDAVYSAVVVKFPPSTEPWPGAVVEFDRAAVEQAIRRAVLVGQAEMPHCGWCGFEVAKWGHKDSCTARAELETPAP